MGREILSYVKTDGPNSTLVDVDNNKIQDSFEKIPVVYFTEQPTHKVRLYKTDGTPYTKTELDLYTGWDFAIAEDYDGVTTPPVRTQAGITITEETWSKTDGTSITGGVINIPVDANTTELQTILGTEPYIYEQGDSPAGRRITVGTELLGYIAPEAEPSLIVQYPFVFRNRRITSETPPGTVGVDYWTPAQIQSYAVEEAPQDGNSYARKNAAWVVAAGTGDMSKSVYDPTNVNGDAFSMDNMVEGVNAKILQSAERNKLSNIGDGAQLQSVVAGTNITVDNTDPQNPIVSSTAAGGSDIVVTDGTTTVDPATQLTFSGAVVGDAGSGEATITITGGGGGEANTASNVGTAGVGVFDSKNGVDLQFKKLNSLTTGLTINLDTPNQKIDFDLDESQINHINLANVGTNTHADIDTHISDNTVHFTQSEINSDNITEGTSKLLMTIAERTSVGLIKTDQGTSKVLSGAGTYILPTAQAVWSTKNDFVNDFTIDASADQNKRFTLTTAAAAERTITTDTAASDKFNFWVDSENADYDVVVSGAKNEIVNYLSATGDFVRMASDAAHGQAQCLTVASDFNTVTFKLKKGLSPTGNVAFRVYALTGSIEVDAYPTGSVLAEGFYDSSLLTTSYTEIEVILNNTLASGSYGISVEFEGTAQATGYVDVEASNTDIFSGNRAVLPVTDVWAYHNNLDLSVKLSQTDTIAGESTYTVPRTNKGVTQFVKDGSDYKVLYDEPVSGGGGGGYTPPLTENAVVDTDALTATTVTNTLAADGTVTIPDIPISNGVTYFITTKGSGAVGRVEFATSGDAFIPTFTDVDEIICIEGNTITNTYKVVR